MFQNHYLIPVQTEGSKKDRVHCLSADDTEAAEDLFVDAKERLLDVNNWGRYGAISDVAFKLTDSRGNLIKRRGRKGDHIRINLCEPGAGNPSEYDWATIEAIEYDDYPDNNMETFAMRLRACLAPVPTNNSEISDSQHQATSTFVIQRIGRKLFSNYHGRNEFEEDETNGMGDVLTLAPCAWLGLSDVQCGSLIQGFVQ